MEKILVTGNKGYIGSVLTSILEEKGYGIRGLDTNFYEGLKGEKLNGIEQIFKDIRNVSEKDLEGISGVIHLAALSNDPLGEFNPKLTKEINFNATIKLAEKSKKMGVKRFIYASSQSMYGISKEEKELEEKGNKNPITEYAKTKLYAEEGLKKLCSDEFTPVYFRPSTVFGVSPKLRCDIVFNNFVACGYTTGKIEIKSDGTPWRPVIHIRDVCNAFISGLEAPKELVSNESFNVGIENGNYMIKDLAEVAQKVVPRCSLTFTREHNKDVRSYNVSFKKILSQLKDYYKPEWDLERGGRELVRFFRDINLTEEMFRGRICNRLPQLKHLINTNKIDNDLFWI